MSRDLNVVRLLCDRVIVVRGKDHRAGLNMPDDLDSYIVAAMRLLDLPIEDVWKAAVRSNLEVTLRLARLVDEFPLPDEAEPAPVFKA
jgi:hypothetical protein